MNRFIDRAATRCRAFRRSGVAFVASGLVLAACEGQQSALAPAGRTATRLAELFWAMTAGAVVIWLAVVALTLYAAYFARRPLSPKGETRLLMGGGVVFPVVVLAGLLAHGLSTLPEILATAPEGALKIEVIGHQWWWRVRYLRDGEAPVELANEIRVPVGRPVEFQLESRDVIHAFWIPALGGKMDMIPGRRTRLLLEPTKTGIYRGVCAEYCGTSHALMSFPVVVEEESAFELWIANQAEPVRAPTEQLAKRGEDLFLANGCGACHTLRGTPADGVIGPDLTHVGGRLSLGAGLLRTERDAFRRWITRTSDLKPNVHMPSFDMLPRDEVEALSSYLEGLR